MLASFLQFADRGKIAASGLSLSLALGLSACSTLPKPATSTTAPVTAQPRQAQLAAVTQFQMEAKLAVQYAGKGYTARMQWQHTPGKDELRIFSPLGQQVALIERTAQSVSLTDQHGQQHQAADVATLTERLLGWRLPLDGMNHWVLGLPHPGSPHQASYLASGEPVTLAQDEWQIDYEDYHQATIHHANAAASDISSTLPQIIRLRQQEVRLKLAIVHW